MVSVFSNIAWTCISHNIFKNTSVKYKEKLRYMKRRLNIYKEELIMKTWHPSRVLEWCNPVDF